MDCDQVSGSIDNKQARFLSEPVYVQRELCSRGAAEEKAVIDIYRERGTGGGAVKNDFISAAEAVVLLQVKAESPEEENHYCHHHKDDKYQ